MRCNMIVAERGYSITVSDPNYLGETMRDGRLTEPSAGKAYRLREAILYSKRLGRPLTEDEMRTFEIKTE